ncbi:hypothetical protein PLACP1_31270 [Planifilum fimeticola]
MQFLLGMDRIMDSRERGDDLLQWLFQLIVDHVEVADENKQFIRRLEVAGDGLNLYKEDGPFFRIIIQITHPL